MNMVERFFADLTQDCVRAGSFASVAELVEAITTYLASRNENPKPLHVEGGRCEDSGQDPEVSGGS